MSRPRLYKVSALVVRQHDFAETDRLLTLFTRERGKVRALAKGVRRPRSKLAAGTQLLCYSEMQLAVGANLDIVTQCQLRRAFYGLRRDLRRLAFASYFADLADSFTEERDGAGPLFDLLLAAVGQAERAQRLELLARVFELRLLAALGYAPQLGSCLLCARELDAEWVAFSPEMGGALCPSCARQAQGWQRLSAGALRTARICAQASPGLLPRVRLSRAQDLELERALRGYIEYHLGRRLRAGSFLDALPGLVARPQPGPPTHGDD